MARRKTRTFTEVELEFMQILWDASEASPEDVQKTLLDRERPLTGGSIRNVLAIMVEKDYITRRKSGKTYLYRARIHEDQARYSIVEHILASVFDGSESLLVAALLKNREVSNDEIKEIERLIADRKREIRQ